MPARVCRCSIDASMRSDTWRAKPHAWTYRVARLVMYGTHATSGRHFIAVAVMARNICMQKGCASPRYLVKHIALQHSLRSALSDARAPRATHSSDENTGHAGGSAVAGLFQSPPHRSFPTCVMHGQPFGVSCLAPGFGKRARRSYNWHNRTTDPVPRAVSRTNDDSNDDKRARAAAARPRAQEPASKGGRQWQ